MHGMTGVRVVSRLIALAVLVAAGIYTLVYLYRWEWNRAVMAGIFFIAAEVALIGTAIVTRLRALEHRMGPPGTSPGADETPRSRHFAWLEESVGGFNVFIPILLGAGVILSLFAWVIERIARFVTAPLAGERAVSPLASLDLPDGGLVIGSGSIALDGPGVAAGPRRQLPPLVRGAITFAAMIGMMLGIWFLREATEARPGGGEPGTTTVELDIATRESGATTEQLVDAFWVACRLRLPRDAELVSAEVVVPGHAVMTLTPVLGDTDQRQFAGCVGDGILDRVDADVIRVETQPAQPAQLAP